MNLYLQALIPILFLLVIIIFVTIKRKYYRIDAIALILLLAVPIFFLGQGVLKTDFNKLIVINRQAISEELSKDSDFSIMVAHKFIDNNNLVGAKKLLDRVFNESAPIAKVEQLRGRIAFLESDFDEAKKKYSVARLYADDDILLAKEIAILEKIKSDSEAAIDIYIKEQSIILTEDYDEESEVELISVYNDNRNDLIEELEKTIKSNNSEELDEIMLTMNDSLDIEKNIKRASNIEKAFEKFIVTEKIEVLDIEEVEKNTRKLNDAMSENDALGVYEELRIARLKGLLLVGQYDEIAKVITDEATVEELMVASELYLDGYIDDSNFNESYINFDENNYDVLIDRCEDIMSNKLQYEEIEVRKDYEDKIANLEALEENQVLEVIKSELIDKNDGGGDSSQIYLRVSKLEQIVLNEENAKDYMTKALETAYLSESEEYAAAMESLVDIIEENNEENLNEIKNIFAFVDDALDHDMPQNFNEIIYYNEEKIGKNSESFEEKTRTDFSDFMNDAIVKKRAIVSIGYIDTIDFPKVSAMVQFDDDLDISKEVLSNYLTISDADERISEYKIEKIHYKKSKIVLLCDVSGSMSSNIHELQNAVRNFAENMRKNEEISVVGFSGDVVFTTPFSDDPDIVASYASKIKTYDATNMYGALLTMENRFSLDDESNNVVILMTDGNDGNGTSNSEVRQKLRELSNSKGLTVFTLGLGMDINATYLNMIADSCNGSFLYVNDENSLTSFYEFIHRQTNNQYKLSFDAIDQKLLSRELKIKLPGELESDRKRYYLGDEDDDFEAFVYEDENTFEIIESDALNIYGLSEKRLYKTDVEHSVTLNGTNLVKDLSVNVKLQGLSNVNLKTEFIDSKTYKLMIPSSVSTGKYDVVAVIDGKTFLLEDALWIIDPTTKSEAFVFGNYKFTSISKEYDSKGNLKLSGDVTMNDWLHFKGDIFIEASKDKVNKLHVLDTEGAYIDFETNSKGLAKRFNEHSKIVSMGKLNNFYIYNNAFDASDYKDFPHSVVEVEYLNLDIISFNESKFKIYPDFTELEISDIEYTLPYQGTIFKRFPNQLTSNDMSGNSKAIFSKNSINYIAKGSMSNWGDGYFKLGKLPAALRKLDIEINTRKDDYSLDIGFNVPELTRNKDLALIFGLDVKGGALDGFMFKTAGTKWTIMTSPVPANIRNLGYEISGLANSQNLLLDTDHIVSFKIDFADLLNYIPEVERFFGEVDEMEMPVATLNNAAMTINLRNFNLKFAGDMTLFTIFDIGDVEIQAGRFDYTNALLDVYNVNQNGLSSKVSLGNTIDTDCFDLSAKIAGELVLGYPVTGIKTKGNIDYDISWGIIKKDFGVSGDFSAGILVNSSNKLQLSFVCQGKNSKNKESGFYVHLTQGHGPKYKLY